jgi:uncharacterized protein involved in exopolysaccharide biosynthesis
MNNIRNQFTEYTEMYRSRKIVTTSVFLMVTSLFIASAYLIEDKYQANALLKYSEEDTGSNYSISSPLGGLGSLAGMNLSGNSTDPIEYSIAVIKSRDFLGSLLDKPGVKKNLIASKKYNKADKTTLFNEKIFNIQTNAWIKDIDFLRIHKKYYLKNLTLTKNRSNGFLTISFNHISPEFSKYFIDLIIKELNESISVVDIENSEKRLELLLQKSTEKSIKDVNNAILRLIENELKNIAYSKTKVEYMLETIDPAYVPMKPFYPNRVLIILMGILAGIASSFLYIYLRISISKN